MEVGIRPVPWRTASLHCPFTRLVRLGRQTQVANGLDPLQRRVDRAQGYSSVGCPLTAKTCATNRSLLQSPRARGAVLHACRPRGPWQGNRCFDHNLRRSSSVPIVQLLGNSTSRQPPVQRAASPRLPPPRRLLPRDARESNARMNRRTDRRFRRSDARCGFCGHLFARWEPIGLERRNTNPL